MTDVGSFDPAVMEAEARAMIAATPRAQWLARRRLAVGCSDLGTLWLASGRATEAERVTAPKYMQANALRFFDEKAGLVKPLRAGKAAAMGRERERLLWQHSRFGLWASTAVYAPDVLPAEMQPLVDRHEPRLTCTVEGWVRDPDGELRAIELKCGRDIRDACPWYWRLQAIGEAAVIGASRACVVYGPRWALDADDPRFPDLPDPVEWEVTFTPADAAEIRSAVREAWTEIERLALNSAAV